MASSLLHELNAIKPRKTRAEIEAARRAAVIAETTVPCCVFFAPWFEIGEPAWNLEHGCSNICQLALEAADKRGALYTTEGVHFKDLDSVAVCNRCELASRKVFNEQRRQSMEKKTKAAGSSGRNMFDSDASEDEDDSDAGRGKDVSSSSSSSDEEDDAEFAGFAAFVQQQVDAALEQAAPAPSSPRHAQHADTVSDAIDDAVRSSTAQEPSNDGAASLTRESGDGDGDGAQAPLQPLNAEQLLSGGHRNRGMRPRNASHSSSRSKSKAKESRRAERRRRRKRPKRPVTQQQQPQQQASEEQTDAGAGPEVDSPPPTSPTIDTGAGAGAGAGADVGRKPSGDATANAKQRAPSLANTASLFVSGASGGGVEGASSKTPKVGLATTLNIQRQLGQSLAHVRGESSGAAAYGDAAWQTPREVVAGRFQDQIRALERRLKQRTRQLEFVRQVYHKDVFLMREHVFHKDRPPPFTPTFKRDLPSSVELNELIRLFNPDSTLEVLERKDVDRLRAAKRRLGTIKQEYKALQRKAATLVKRHQKLSDSARKVAERCDNAEAAERRAQARIAALEEELAAKSTEVEEVHVEMAHMSTETEKLRQHTVGLQTQAERAEAEVQTLTGALEEANQIVKSNVRTQAQLRQARQELKVLRQKLAANVHIKRERDEALKTLKQRDEELAATRKELAETQQAKADAAAAAQAAAEAAQQREKALHSSVAALKAQLEERNDTIAGLRDDVRRVEANLRDTQRELDRAEQETAKHKRDAKGAVAALRSAQDRIQELEQELEKAGDELDEQSTQIEDLKDTISSLEEQKAELASQVAALGPYKPKCEALEMERKKLLQYLTMAREKQDTLVDVLATLQYDFARAQSGLCPTDRDDALKEAMANARAPGGARAYRSPAVPPTTTQPAPTSTSASASASTAAAPATPGASSGSGGRIDLQADAARALAPRPGELTPVDAAATAAADKEKLVKAANEHAAALRATQTRRKLRGEVHQDVAWLQDGDDANLEAFVDALADEVATNRSWGHQIVSMEHRLRHTYEGRVRGLEDDLAARVRELENRDETIAKHKEEMAAVQAEVAERDAQLDAAARERAALQERQRELEANVGMAGDEVQALQREYRRSTRLARKLDVELQIIRRAFQRLQEDMTAEAEARARAKAEADAALAAAKDREAEVQAMFDRAQAELEATYRESRDAETQVRFGPDMTRGTQTDVLVAPPPARVGPPPRIDLMLPQGSYYYMPYYTNPFLRPLRDGQDTGASAATRRPSSAGSSHSGASSVAHSLSAEDGWDWNAPFRRASGGRSPYDRNDPQKGRGSRSRSPARRSRHSRHSRPSSRGSTGSERRRHSRSPSRSPDGNARRHRRSGSSAGPMATLPERPHSAAASPTAGSMRAARGMSPPRGRSRSRTPDPGDTRAVHPRVAARDRHRSRARARAQSPSSHPHQHQPVRSSSAGSRPGSAASGSAADLGAAVAAASRHHEGVVATPRTTGGTIGVLHSGSRQPRTSLAVSEASHDTGATGGSLRASPVRMQELGSMRGASGTPQSRRSSSGRRREDAELDASLGIVQDTSEEQVEVETYGVRNQPAGRGLHVVPSVAAPRRRQLDPLQQASAVGPHPLPSPMAAPWDMQSVGSTSLPPSLAPVSADAAGLLHTPRTGSPSPETLPVPATKRGVPRGRAGAQPLHANTATKLHSAAGSTAGFRPRPVNPAARTSQGTGDTGSAPWQGTVARSRRNQQRDQGTSPPPFRRKGVSRGSGDGYAQPSLRGAAGYRHPAAAAAAATVAASVGVEDEQIPYAAPGMVATELEPGRSPGFPATPAGTDAAMRAARRAVAAARAQERAELKARSVGEAGPSGTVAARRRQEGHGSRHEAQRKLHPRLRTAAAAAGVDLNH